MCCGNSGSPRIKPTAADDFEKNADSRYIWSLAHFVYCPCQCAWVFSFQKWSFFVIQGATSEPFKNIIYGLDAFVKDLWNAQFFKLEIYWMMKHPCKGGKYKTDDLLRCAWILEVSESCTGECEF